MGKHITHKSTPEGRTLTIERRAARHSKYQPAPRVPYVHTGFEAGAL